MHKISKLAEAWQDKLYTVGLVNLNRWPQKAFYVPESEEFLKSSWKYPNEHLFLIWNGNGAISNSI